MGKIESDKKLVKAFKQAVEQLVVERNEAICAYVLEQAEDAALVKLMDKITDTTTVKRKDIFKLLEGK